MTRLTRKPVGVVFGLLAAMGGLARTIHAQVAAPSADSLQFRRAQRMVNDGDSIGGRALLDSLVNATRDGTRARADALYWRALFSPDALTAKTDLLTIVIDYALSPRAADALLRLGRNAYASGDRPAAVVYLDRLLLEYPASGAAADGWLWLGRARIDDGNLQQGCRALDSAQTRLRPADVERQRQVSFARQPCRALATAPRPSAPAGPTGAPSKSPAGPSGAAARPDTAARSRRWSVQVAAYKLLDDAEKLGKSLKARGYDARVDSLTLFHVRIGVFRTRAEASALVAKLKQQQIVAIVVEATGREP